MKCQKRKYKTETEARKKLRKLKKLKRKERRFYYCRECGAFHLTHRKAEDRKFFKNEFAYLNNEKEIQTCN